MSLFVSCFLLVFRPFGLSSLSGFYGMAIIFGFGLVTFGVLLFTHLVVPYLLPKQFTSSSWTVSREIGWSLFHISLIGFGNLTYLAAFNLSTVDVSTVLNFQFYTLAVGSIPIVAITLTKTPGSVQHEKRPSAIHTQAFIELRGENREEVLRLKPQQLIALQSEGNYVKVIVGTDDKLKSRLLRGSLSRVERQLKAHPNFMRVHRTSIINTTNISDLKGDSQGGRVWLKGMSSPLPVSRSHIRSLRQQVGSNIFV